MWGERPNVFILECFHCRWEVGEVGKLGKVEGWQGWEGEKGGRLGKLRRFFAWPQGWKDSPYIFCKLLEI